MAAGQALLALAGPVGIAIAGVSILSGCLLVLKSKSDQKRLEDIYILISERDVANYQQAIAELNERISRIAEEAQLLNDALERVKSFGLDYNKMADAQQYELGSYVNLMLSSTQILTNPILGLQPKYTEDMLNDYLKQSDGGVDVFSDNQKELIVYLANLLYKIKLDEKDLKLLRKSFAKNEELLDSLHVDKEEITIEAFNGTHKALDYVYEDQV